MKIKFKDVSSRSVEARAVIEIAPMIFLNEVTILKINGEIIVELPKKNFVGKDNRKHFLDILTFENENVKTLWLLEIRDEYFSWRKRNKKVMVYET